jgi:hypothetical protein
MELIGPEIAPSGPSWMSRLVEALQPLSVRADRLGSIELFAGLQRRDLEFAASCFAETLVERGTRMTVQGHPSLRLWLITQGEALVSADARPIRVAARGDAAEGATLLTRLSESKRPTRSIEPGCDPRQIADSVVVGVGEAADVDFVEDCAAPPGSRHGR